MRYGLIIGFFSILLSGCASYTTPGAAADFSKLGLTPDAKAALTDKSVQAILDKRPLVTFPAAIAVARVQAPDYNSYTYNRYRPLNPPAGAYSLITIRDVETDDDFNAIAKLPQVTGVAGIKRILLDRPLNNDEALRTAAAKLHANLLLFYTFDTAFHTDTYVPPLGLITLGLFPNEKAQVTTTASAVLMDVNNGYIYAVVGGSLQSTTSSPTPGPACQAMDEARLKAERQAAHRNSS